MFTLISVPRFLLFVLFIVLLMQFTQPASARDSLDFSYASNDMCSNITEIPSAECDALNDLYQSTNGGSWANNSNWLQTNTPCGWHGVTCSNGHVIRLDLTNNQLSGSLPGSLDALTSLQYLVVDQNQIGGAIPGEIGNLSNLLYLHLAHNQLTGTIPSNLGNLQNVVFLYLHNNQLSGTIPTTMGNLGQVKNLTFSLNPLTGELPTELGDAANLHQLHMFSTQLDGPLPSSLTNLARLTHLYFTNTTLCEPQDAAFQNWLTGVANVQSTGLSCGPVVTPTPPASPPIFPTYYEIGESKDTNSVVFGDVNNDGNLDLIEGNGGPNRVYLNDGNGNYPSGQYFGNTGATSSIALADLDSDGDLDVVDATSNSRSYIHLNDGSGSFTQQPWFTPLSLDAYDVAVGDITGDGLPDIVLAHGTAAVRIYKNNGGATFVEWGYYIHPTQQASDVRSVDLGDANGDGHLDLLAGNAGHTGNYTSVVYFNNGSGYFLQSTTFGSVAARARLAAFGDVNNDSVLDVIVHRNGVSHVYLNNGSGQFSSHPAMPFSPFGLRISYGLDVGDVDNDGDLDLAIAVALGDGPPHGISTLHLNLGTGEFNEHIPLATTLAHDLAFGDIDNDGDLDLAIANHGENQIYVNTTNGVSASFVAPIEDSHTEGRASEDLNSTLYLPFMKN